MLGLMQDWPLLCHRIIEHAAAVHGTQEVVTRSVEGPIHRTNYAEIRDRALKVSQRLDRDGIKLGDRVATIAWNTWRHVETWYGIMGIGAICHTVNPRLFPDQIAWIINHAQPRMLLTDPKVLILDEPTRGVDVGAKYEIYKLIGQLAQRGMSIVMVSSELPEVLGISDRVLVIGEGELRGDFINDGLTQEDILTAAIRPAQRSTNLTGASAA